MYLLGKETSWQQALKSSGIILYQTCLKIQTLRLYWGKTEWQVMHSDKRPLVTH